MQHGSSVRINTHSYKESKNRSIFALKQNWDGNINNIHSDDLQSIDILL